MIVLDASAVVELVLATATGQRLAWRLRSSRVRAQAPHLLSVEVMNALRRLLAAGAVAEPPTRMALIRLRTLDVRRWEHEPLVGRAWQLREILTPYDAMYVALAEVLDAPLLTTDGRLARSTGHRAAVELIS